MPARWITIEQVHRHHHGRMVILDDMNVELDDTEPLGQLDHDPEKGWFRTMRSPITRVVSR